MQKIITFFHFCSITLVVQGQFLSDPSYGIQENYQMRKNKVRLQIAENLTKNYIEYDSLGREAKVYQDNSFDTTYFEYRYRKDTLIKYQYTQSREGSPQRITISKFVYNQGGRLLFTSHISGPNSGTDTVAYHTLIQAYNRKGLLVTARSYTDNAFVCRLSDAYTERKTGLNIVFSALFYYDSQKRLKKAIWKESGKLSEDVTAYFYDRKNRLVKTSSYSREGYPMERMAFNVTKRVYYRYERNSVTLTTKTQYQEYMGGPQKKIENGWYKTEMLENGLVKSISYNPGTTSTFVTTYTYEYFDN